MASTQNAYKEYYCRQHRVLAAYLAAHCWHAGFDAVIVDRATLAHMHELKNFTRTRLNWLRADVKAYFPHVCELYYQTPQGKFAAAVFSRVEIPNGFGAATMHDVPRAVHWRKEGYRVCALSELVTTELKFTEKEAATFLCQASVGLTVPTRRPLIVPRIRPRLQ